MAESEQASSIPTRTIHEAYRDALAARRQYQQSVGGPLEADTHQQLQEAVAAYYEVLRPLVSAANNTEKLWEEVNLWPTAPKYQTVHICRECMMYAPADADDTLPLGSMCPGCGDGEIQLDEVPAIDDEGCVEYRYLRGLKAVEDIWDDRVERTVEYEDALGTHTETVVESRLVPAEHLRIIARRLDEALQKLDLHAEVESGLPKGTMTEEL